MSRHSDDETGFDWAWQQCTKTIGHDAVISVFPTVTRASDRYPLKQKHR